MIDRDQIVSAKLELEHLASAAEVIGEHGECHAGHTLHVAADFVRQFLNALAPLALRDRADEDVSFIDRSGGAAAERRVGVVHFGVRPRDACRLLCLEPRVLKIRPRRRLDRNDELGAIILREKADAHRPHRWNELRQQIEHRDAGDADADLGEHGQALGGECKNEHPHPCQSAEQSRHAAGKERERGEKSADRQRTHRGAMIQRPRDHVAVVVRLPVEPVIEDVELLRDPRLLLFGLMWIGPIGGQHRVERE